MHIDNIRLGHACNSSSSHTILLAPRHNVVDDLRQDGFGYGWENFTLASSKAKMGYFFAALVRALCGIIGPRGALQVAQALTGIGACTKDIDNVYIDHESAFGFPGSWDGKWLDPEFLEDFKQFLLREDVIVLGGNDNGEGHPLAGIGTPFSPPAGYGPGLSVCRKDPAGYWTIFHRGSGAKVRCSFDPSAASPFPRASAPELVDIGLTDYCDRGCHYCYKGSTPEGRHADPLYVEELLRTLAAARCFEVAFGGGEPLAHPDFLRFASNCRYLGIVPNVTTRRLDLLANALEGPSLVETLGAIAVSVEDVQDVETLIRLTDKLGYEPTKFGVQVVDGVVHASQFGLIFARAQKEGLRLTLLGYKSTGRGANQAPRWKTDWVRQVDRAVAAGTFNPYLFAVDTAVVQQYKSEIDKRYCSQTYDVSEGKYSCYIDAVSGRIAPSSFCPEEQYKPLADPKAVLEGWAAIAPEPA